MKAKTTPIVWAAAAICLAAATGMPARAQQTQPLAPPIGQPGAATWDWREIPVNERIPIVRAIFDQNGYQLIDDNGQSIFVPFAGNNLYVMRFGRTSGQMFFINEDGRTPTLYLPEGAWLENAGVGNARWFPFPNRYYYTRPVFLGPAPTWDAYINMGWYPGMVIHGGYWCNDPWRFGMALRPMNGLFISVGGRSCYDWGDYVYFYRTNPVRRVVFVDRPIFRDTVIVRQGRGDYSLPPRKDIGGGNGRGFDRPAGGRYDGGNSRYETRNGVPYNPPRSNDGGHEGGGRYDRGNSNGGNGGYDRTRNGNGGNGGGRYDRGSGNDAPRSYESSRPAPPPRTNSGGYDNTRPTPPPRSGGYSGRESGGYSAPRDSGSSRRDTPPTRSDSGSSRGREERRQRG